MKKTGLFKIIMFILLGIVVVTWIFSAGYFSNGEVSTVEMYNIGFFDFFALFFASFEFEYFIQMLILLLSIGALYGVLGKTGKYRAWIEKIANNWKGQEKIFLIVVSVLIALLTAMFDYELCIVIFFPLLMSIILAMGYDKITTIVATFGAMFVGIIGNIKGDSINGTIAELLEGATGGFYFKIALFLFSLVALIFFLFKAKKVKKTTEMLEDEDRFIGEKVVNKYSTVPLIIVISLLFVILIVACTKWSEIFGIEFFNNLHNSVTSFSPKLPYFHITADGIEKGTKQIEIVKKILGKYTALGTWYNSEMAIVCFMSAILVGLLYRIKGIFAAMYEGMKKMLAPALMLMLCYTVIYFSGSQMFYPTIASLILSISSKFSVVLSSIVVIFGSVTFVDFLYVANYILPQIAANGADASIVGLIAQSMYGVTMFIAPTSAMLVFGLTYLGVPYKTWIKKTWKLIVALLAISLVILLLAKYL